MQNTQFKLYYQNVVGLVRSMIIKLDIVAETMNEQLTAKGLPIPSDPKEWRYYKHLAGDYCPHDTPMVITSLDTGEEIILTKENLKVHKKTGNIYEHDSAYQDAVIKRYPDQICLVMGIFNPIPYDVAIAAKNGEVLHYNSVFVEKQETTLIQRVSEWIYSWYYKNNMHSYRQYQNLFSYVITTQMYLFLPSVVMDIRFELIHTGQTHSFHIRNYLASHYGLDEFMLYMNTKQMMYLYRNLKYLQTNMGKQEVFDDLVEILFTERSLPTFCYDLAQGRPELEESIQPTGRFIRDAINFRRSATTNEFVDYDIEDILYKESLDTPANPRYLQQYTLEARNKLETSRISRLPTKIIEVTAVDPEDALPFKLIDVQINQWIYYAATGQYNYAAELINPQTGEEFKLTMPYLCLVYFYSFYRGFHGVTLPEIPKVTAVGVAPDEVLLAKDYLPYLQYNHWTGYDHEIKFFVGTHVYPDDQYKTSEDFYELTEQLLASKLRRYNYVNKVDRYTDKLSRDTMFNLNYRDYICDLNPDGFKNFDTLFATIGIEPDLMSPEAWQDLSVECLDAATLFATNAKISLSDIQAAMVGIFKRLSSYTVQVLKEVVSQDSLAAKPYVVQVGETPGDIEQEQNVYGHHATILDAPGDAVMVTDIRWPPTEILAVTIEENRDVDIVYNVKAEVAHLEEEHFIVANGLAARATLIEDDEL